MNLPAHLQKFNAAILFCISFLMLSSLAHAQTKSAADTIAYLIKIQKNQNQLSDELNKLGDYYLSVGDFESATLAVNKSIDLAKKNNYDKAVFDAYSILGGISLSQGNVAKTLSLADECLALATRKQSDYGANRAKYLLVVMVYQQGNMDSVISLSKSVLDAPRVTYDSVNLPRFTSILGNAYLARGDLRQANKYYLEALDMAERTHSQKLQTVCLGNLALINNELMDYREALKYQRKGLALALKANQIREVAGNFLGMGNIYKRLEINDSAIYFYNKALPLYQQVGGIGDIALIHNNLGGLLVYMDQPDSGMYYLALAKHEFLLQNDTLKMASNAIAMAEVWYRMAGAKQDRSYLKKALTELLACKQLVEKKGIEDLKMHCYYYLSIVYEALGNTAQAFDYLKKYNLINNAIRSKEYTGQIAEMQTKYESEKKELEITRLNATKLLDAEKIARQQTLNYSLSAIAVLLLIFSFLIFRNIQKKRFAEKQVAILEKQNAIESMRNKIASDVHDEMGANLTRMGLSAQQLLQSPAIPEKEKHLAEKMALLSKEIITGMREIIWASNPANDNLKSMLGFMRQYIDRFFDGTNIRADVDFPYDAGEVTLHPEVRRNLFFILKESLNNAVKYSGSDRVEIGFLRENERFNLHIKDYGKGIDDQHINDFNDGLRNMKMRAELIQSLFHLITAPGQGVHITIEGKLY